MRKKIKRKKCPDNSNEDTKKIKKIINVNEKPLISSESFQNETKSSNENSKDSLKEIIKGLSLNPT